MKSFTVAVLSVIVALASSVSSSAVSLDAVVLRDELADNKISYSSLSNKRAFAAPFKTLAKHLLLHRRVNP